MLNATFAYQNMGLGSKFRIYHPAPSLLLSFATILRLICRQKICADSFFRPVEAFAYAAGYVQKRLNSLSRNEENVSIE